MSRGSLVAGWLGSPGAKPGGPLTTTGEVPLRYTPFSVDLQDVTDTHLADLRDVAEGWYVEYKSTVPKPRELAKSLASFANRYGGWLVLGVEHDRTDNTAHAFPGIRAADVPAAVEQLRNASKDLLQPSVPYRHRILPGPLDLISLEAGHCIIIIHIPEGASTPYVQNDGRVYVRTGDSSSPVPARDRATFDELHRRAEGRLSFLEALVNRSPEVSQREEDVPYLHLFLCSDPFQVLGHRYNRTFSEFSAAMAANPVPFDNIYTSQDGYIARQPTGGDPYNRVFTWEFSRHCNSFVTLPLPRLGAAPEFLDGWSDGIETWSTYSHGEGFAKMLVDRGLVPSRVLNLNLLISVLLCVICRHRGLTGQVGIKGPFYVKASIENVWRAVPFIDTEEYMRHVQAFGVPVVQNASLTVPPGLWPAGFIALPELERVPNENEQSAYEDAIPIWIAILQALGIPGQILADSGNRVAEVANREARRHRDRLDGPTVISSA